MNENSESGYIFGTKIPKPMEDKGILWAPSRQVEFKSHPSRGVRLNSGNFLPGFLERLKIETLIVSLFGNI